MKLKIDEKTGVAVLENGLPIYQYEDGSESPFDADATLTGLNGGIKNLEEEKNRHAEDKIKLKTQLDKFKGIDPVKATEHAKLVKALEDKQLIDAQGVEAIKKDWSAAMKNSFEEEKKAIIDGFTQKETTWEKAKADYEALVFDLSVANKFATSEYFSGKEPKTAMPPEYAKKIFGDRFEMKIDGRNLKIIAKDANGREIYSKKNHGELADFDEAISQIVEEQNKKYTIMNPGKQGGPRTVGNLSSPSGKDFDNLTPTEKIRVGLKKQFGIG
jgi:hypothetical protein